MSTATPAPRILIVTQYFLPEMGAPQARLAELGGWLQRLGWTVDVLTALPNYPSGRVFAGYRGRSWMRETVAGLDTVRTWILPSQSARILPRMTSYLTFAGSAAILGGRRCQRPDLIWAETPPLFLGVAIRWLSRRWKAPYVLNVSDLWPESFVEMGRLRRGSRVHRALEALERWCYAGAIGITGQSREIVAHVRAMRPDAATEVVSNGVDPARFGREYADAEWRHEAGWNGQTVFAFAGLHGLAQGLEQVLAAAETLRHRPDILFALVGDGPEKGDLMKSAHERALTNVRFYDTQPRERMPAILASADVALIPLASRLRGAVPSKIYEAMASELPVLIVAEGEAAERVQDVGAGVAVPCADRDALVAAIVTLADSRRLRASLGAAGRIAVQALYSREAAARRTHAFLQSCLARARRQPTAAA